MPNIRAAAALLVLALCAAPALAQDDGHGHGVRTELTLSDLSPEKRAAALDAWSHVYCNCPREDWSKTLSNCPDGCAIPQKQEIMQRVEQGWDLKRIVAEQVQKYGPKAAADSGTATNGTLMVLAGLVAGAGLAGFVLAQWKRTAAERRVASEQERAARPAVSSEIDAIERELQEID